MRANLEFAELLRLIDEQSAAFRAVVASAPDLGVPVPSCPEWTLSDLVQHIGEGRRKWAAIVAAGPAPAPAPESEWAGQAPREPAARDAWLAESTELMLGALRAAGPDGECWTWWTDSQSPPTGAAVARHQLQQLAVHTYDAQLALGAPQPLPGVVALDGVEEFLVTCCSTDSPWPHDPAVVTYHATEGRSWSVELSGAGARIARGPAPATVDASATGTANELVLFFYGRIPVDGVKLDGDRRQFEWLFAWDPTA